jgi:CheY-like chemotaxis protein
MTPLTAASDRSRILEHGFDGCIAKPITPATFVPHIERLIPTDKRPETAS